MKHLFVSVTEEEREDNFVEDSSCAGNEKVAALQALGLSFLLEKEGIKCPSRKLKCKALYVGEKGLTHFSLEIILSYPSNAFPFP